MREWSGRFLVYIDMLMDLDNRRVLQEIDLYVTIVFGEYGGHGLFWTDERERITKARDFSR
ncbi:MAG: hypothetical protein LBC37_00590 [Zoogloeaceae bacterium]|nr:hypothetical protein [Zoogloeaceae bacterium]